MYNKHTNIYNYKHTNTNHVDTNIQKYKKLTNIYIQTYKHRQYWYTNIKTYGESIIKIKTHKDTNIHTNIQYVHTKIQRYKYTY